jgi:hypothetical protein
VSRTDADLALRYLAEYGFRRSDPIGGGGRARHHAVSGSLDPAEALALLDDLRLPADTAHLPRLRAVLRKGVANHYQDPAAWRA